MLHLFLAITFFLLLVFITFLSINNFFVLTYNFFFFFSLSTTLTKGTLFFIVKLTISWFIVVWLRLNLLRYRFDQVASYTWHELLLYCLFFLLGAVSLILIF